MQQIEIALSDTEYTQVLSRAQEAGKSVSEWVENLVRHASGIDSPRDPLFGILADAPDLADTLDAIVAERGDRVLRAS